MRKFTTFLLLASAAVPAMAQPDEDNDNQSRHSRSSRSDNRPQRAERAQRNEAQQEVRVERQEARFERQQSRQDGNGGVAGMRERVQQAQQQQVQQQQEVQQRQAERSERYSRYQRQDDGRRNRVESVQQSQPYQNGGLMPRQRQYRSVPDTTSQVLQSQTYSRDGRTYSRDGRNYNRDGTVYHRDGQVRTQHNGTYTRWARNDWRNDSRYDWRRYRDRNRSTFHIGFYYDPFGYNYRQYGIGSFLNAGYYQSNYWINDPWQYRLPPAYGPYRWVRYHRDALLIDTWSGEVVDVIYSFFW
ncbi:MAG: RcnB family protein [Sphingomicrobium sp.]